MAFVFNFYSTFTDFENDLSFYQKNNHCCFRIQSSDTVEKTNKRTKWQIPEDFEYSRCVFVCTHFGEHRYSGKGIKSNTKSSATGCKVFLHLAYDYALRGLVVRKQFLEHNHPTNPDTYVHELRNKRLTPGQRQELKEIVQLQPVNEKLLSLLRNKYGKVLSLKDVRHLKSQSAVFALWKTWKLLKYKSRKAIIVQDASSYIKEKTVVIVTTSQEWEAIFPKVMDDLTFKKVLGLDCEWVSKNKVALLQLCTPHGLCVLVRLSKMTNQLPDTLISLLANRSILKTGVAVVNDGKKLMVDYGWTVNGCVDLRHLLERVSSVRNAYNCTSKGLKSLSSEILHVGISKDPKIRCGNWEAEHYTQAQIDYAATDAAVAVDIFIHLVCAKMGLVHCENSNNNSPTVLQIGDNDRDADVSNTEFWKVACSICQGVVDVGYMSLNDGKQNSNRNPGRKLKDDNKIYSTRKRPLWDNCRLQAPDGTTLCTCDKRKAQWYLDKELADKISDDPITVRLHFEPSSRPENERNYYLQEKDNQCVVCGSDKDYVRKFVIPFEYKKFFPSALKDHCSHDVLLLCTACHRKSCDHDSLLRQRLAEECNAPIDSGSTSRTVVDHDLQKVKSAGRALMFNRSSIPPSRVKELERILMDFFGSDSLPDEIIEKASQLDIRQASEDYVPHGKRVVRHMVRNGGLLTFQARWRKHFLDTMYPQFLPAFWSVDYVPEGWTKMENT